MRTGIVELLDIKILPYVIFLVVPVLGRMSDPDDDIRFLATRTFATLVKLVPLEVSDVSRVRSPLSAGANDPVHSPVFPILPASQTSFWLSETLSANS